MRARPRGTRGIMARPVLCISLNGQSDERALNFAMEIRVALAISDRISSVILTTGNCLFFFFFVKEEHVPETEQAFYFGRYTY